MAGPVGVAPIKQRGVAALGGTEKVAALRKKYSPDGKLLVGFSWMSTNKHFGELKSIPPAEFTRLLSFTSHMNFVSLQYGDNVEDLKAFKELGAEIIVDKDIDPLLSLDDCAAQIAAMDYIVSVSNSTVHFAGALGVKTFAIIPVGHGRVWYWFTGMKNTPWYDSVELIRCEQPAQWRPAIDQAWLALMNISMTESIKRLKVA